MHAQRQVCKHKTYWDHESEINAEKSARNPCPTESEKAEYIKAKTQRYKEEQKIIQSWKKREWESGGDRKRGKKIHITMPYIDRFNNELFRLDKRYKKKKAKVQKSDTKRQLIVRRQHVCETKVPEKIKCIQMHVITKQCIYIYIKRVCAQISR